MDDAPLYICVLILYSLPPGTNKIPANPSVVIEDDEIVDLKGSYISYYPCMYNFSRHVKFMDGTISSI